MQQVNVLGTELQPCSYDPMTGFYRTGCCENRGDDPGLHVVCCRVTDDFLAFSAEMGNDLSTPRPEFGFAGLRDGDTVLALNGIEANAMGTPAVVYPVGGLVDSTVDGVTGLVSTEETPVSLAVKILQLLDDPVRYDQLREVAWRRSFEFRWEKVLRPTCDWLENLARDEDVM